jgi:hypothetical protein
VTLTFEGRAPAVAGADAGIGSEPGWRWGSCRRSDSAARRVKRLRRCGTCQPCERPARRAVCRFDPRQGHGQAELAAIGSWRRPWAAVELQVVAPSVDGFAADLATVADAVAASGLAPAAIMAVPAADLTSTPPGSPWPASPPLDALYLAARSAFPGVRLGGGMFTHFTELNRKRPPLDLLDFSPLPRRRSCMPPTTGR